MQFKYKRKIKEAYMPEQEIDKNVWVLKATPKVLESIYQGKDMEFKDATGKALWTNKKDAPYIAFSGKCPHLGCGYQMADAQNAGAGLPLSLPFKIYDAVRQSAGWACAARAGIPCRLRSHPQARCTIIDMEFKAGTKARFGLSNGYDHATHNGTQPSAIEKVLAFVDERVGLKTLQAKMLNEPVPGGSRWAYVFGSILLLYLHHAGDHRHFADVLLRADRRPCVCQYPSPSIVDYGWFLLGYHFWGSTAMWSASLRICRKSFCGRVQKPRELVWLVGLALFGIVMGFGFTGYLLPWDQRAYSGCPGRSRDHG